MNPQKKFWKWVRNKTPVPENPNETTESRTLFLNGTIAEESWFDDDVTPALFRSDLENGTGDITVWVNSPGGDCFAAAQIYNMLRDYKGKVTVKVDGLAASAASVIAMAGDTVLVSPVSMIMIHNPSTVAMGDTAEMQKAIQMLSEVKDSIINAYQAKTGLSRNKLSKLMDEETWMDAGKAVELGFADGVIERDELYSNKAVPIPDEDDPDEESDEGNPEEKSDTDEKKQPGEDEPSGMLFSRYQVAAAINKKLCDYAKHHPAKEESLSLQIDDNSHLHRVADLEKRLDLIKQFI
ncbi:MAG: Clp protease ClpP [Lachnospiraceae bacterium]|nr:Clp protease ClpP [Lachnospiraceae bacterium]